jgi:hypothetical protein
MKYSELNDKDRWAAIRAGVKAGYNSIDDIEKAYNEYANGGSSVLLTLEKSNNNE